MAVRMRKPLPAAIQNAPELEHTDKLLFEAFVELHTCRLVEEGRIPWTALNEYVRVYEIDDPYDPSIRGDFEAIIRQLDDEYLVFMAERRKAQQPSKTGGGKGALGGRKNSHDVRKPRA